MLTWEHPNHVHNNYEFTETKESLLKPCLLCSQRQLVFMNSGRTRTRPPLHMLTAFHPP